MGDRYGTAHGNHYDPTGSVFISHRQNDDIEHAKRLDRFLRAGDPVPWCDLVDLLPGEIARRVRETFEEGIAAAALIVMPGIQQSQFVPAEELPELFKFEQEPYDFSFLVFNIILKQDETASNDGRSQGNGVGAGQPPTDDAPADHPLGGCG